MSLEKTGQSFQVWMRHILKVPKFNMDAKVIWRKLSFSFIRNVGAFESSIKFRRISISYELKTAKLPWQCPFKLHRIPDSSTSLWEKTANFAITPQKGLEKTRLYFDPTIGKIVLQKTTEKTSETTKQKHFKRYHKYLKVSPYKYKLYKSVTQKTLR